MAAPELVIANTAYKRYPGGVIALRCSDWMAGARGTLSSEVDARASSGQAVRDTQQSSTQIFDSLQTSFGEVDDTLVIPISSLPLETQGSFTSGMTYRVWVSLAIEGDWDPAEAKTTRTGTQDSYYKTCAVCYYDSTYETATNLYLGSHSAFYLPRQRPNFMLVSLGTFPRTDGVIGDEEIHLRAFSSPGTTTELLLDQIHFIPWVTSGTRYNEWRSGDFRSVPGSWADTVQDPGFVDGADGGDSNGKFTWFPYTLDGNSPLNFSTADGGGDYQKTDSEYMVEVATDIPLDISKTRLDPTTYVDPTGEHAYSVNGAEFYLPDIWISDSFSRTASDWGLTPEGFAWEVLNLVNSAEGDPRITFSTDGSKGIVTYNFAGGSVGGGEAFMGIGKVREQAVSTRGARIAASDLSFKGVVEISAIPPTHAQMWFSLSKANDPVIGARGNGYSIYVDAQTSIWRVEHGGSTNVAVSSDFDISGWFGTGVPLGWRIEIRRYRIRARVWDASGAEPATWDFDDYRPVGTGAFWYDYPYGDDPFTAKLGQYALTPQIDMEFQDYPNALNMTAEFDDVEVLWDPENGDIADVHALMERPEGSEVGRITIPWGAWHIVYWGARQWAEDYGNSPWFGLAYASKVWNDAGASELQRSEVPFWWFRSIHEFIIPMNWRSSTREGGHKRILKGDT